MTTKIINKGYPTGLSVASKYNYVSITSTGSVGGTGLIANGYATVVNYGTLNAVAADHTQGVYLNLGGAVLNGSTIYGYVGVKSSTPFGTAVAAGQVTNGGTISGQKDGIELLNGGYVTNYAAISGGRYGVDITNADGVVYNVGTILSRYTLSFHPLAAVAMQSGYVANRGLMGGFNDGVKAFGSTVVDNSGTIGGSYYGVHLFAGGNVVNGSANYHSSVIYGDVAGVFVSGASIANFATIEGAGYGSTGVFLTNGSALTNGSSTDDYAKITGYKAGVSTSGTASTIVNFGEIYAKGTASGSAGVVMSGGGLTNGSAHDTSDYIGGYTGATVSAGGSVSNFAEILGNGQGASASGIVFTAGGSLTNGSAASHGALVEGYTAVKFAGATGTVNNFGYIEGLAKSGGVSAIYLGDGGRVNNGSLVSKSAFISGYDGVIGAGGATSVYNFGTIQAVVEGVVINNGGLVRNGAATDQTARVSGYLGVVGETVPLTVDNFGTITSSAGLFGGITTQEGVTVVNGGTGDKVAQIVGYNGVYADLSGGVGASGASTITNFATITGQGTNGIFSGGGGVIVNGVGGDVQALVQGATNGVWVTGASASVTNLGTITAGRGVGVGLKAGGYVTNGGGANRTALITGYYAGVYINGGIGGLKNFGTVGGNGGAGTYGAEVLEAGGLQNGSATNSTALIEGYGGVESGVIAENFGTILALGDAGGAGLDLTGGALVNGTAAGSKALIEGYNGVVTAASVAATLINFGTIEGDSGKAVAFNSSLDDLVVEAGSTFIGSINGDGGTLELGTGTGTLTGLLAAGNVTVSGSMATTTFTNFGTVQVDAPASFTLAGGGLVSSGQTLIDNGTVTTTGTLTVGGALTTAGTLAGTGTLSISNGTAAFNGGTSLTIALITEGGPATATVGTNMTYAGTWLQTSGTVSVNAGDKLTLTGSGDSFAGTLAGAGTVAFTGGSATLSKTTLTAASVFIGAATVTLTGAISNQSAISITSPSVIVAAAGATLYSGGTVTLSNNATNQITGASAAATLTNLNNKIYGAGQLGGGKMTLVNAAGGLIDGNQATGLTIDTGAATIANAGLIESAGSGLLTIKSAVNNTGTLYASGGTLIASGAVTGTGKVTIGAGTADFASTLANSVTFTASSTGTLELNKSQSYTGQVSGFSKTGTNFLDLADIAFTAGTTKATYSGTTTSGVLTVTDGTHTAKINLTGNYTASTFVLATDGHGGTLIHDPAKATATPAPIPITSPWRIGPAPLVPFIGAMASFGAAGASTSSASLMAPLTRQAALALPHSAVG